MVRVHEPLPMVPLEISGIYILALPSHIASGDNSLGSLKGILGVALHVS